MAAPSSPAASKSSRSAASARAREARISSQTAFSSVAFLCAWSWATAWRAACRLSRIDEPCALALRVQGLALSVMSATGAACCVGAAIFGSGRLSRPSARVGIAGKLAASIADDMSDDVRGRAPTNDLR